MENLPYVSAGYLNKSRKREKNTKLSAAVQTFLRLKEQVVKERPGY
ncbi:hypothetical protein [Christensenella hongkongensis]|uniref:Uncharacterized protein n=1 Tax=Christensenella hongkongensis TaxID=270498 RepID=A0A0M2NHJ4_9FIRM|nr:hypothetical protein [Christensenella hongkongensis]KKI51628.1 hypothetical protein CHK_0794 [Christensenella hongkongensis]